MMDDNMSSGPNSPTSVTMADYLANVADYRLGLLPKPQELVDLPADLVSLILVLG